MQNLFDSDNYPDGIPAELTAGSRWAWVASDITAAYPTATYTLKYRISQMADPFSDFEVAASKVSSAHVVEVSVGDTANYAAGEYHYQAVIVRDSDSEEISIDRGYVTILPDLSNNPGETASWTYQVLLAIRAAIEAGAGNSQRSVTISGRTIEWRSYAELMGLEEKFESRWNREKAAADRKAGRATNSRVLVKMSA